MKFLLKPTYLLPFIFRYVLAGLFLTVAIFKSLTERNEIPRLYINLVHHSRECDALSDVLFGGEPGDGTFYAEPEAAVRH